MKKTVSILLAAVMLFCFCSCKEKNPYEEHSYDQMKSEVAEHKDVSNFICFYSVDNEDRTDDEILVTLSSNIFEEDAESESVDAKITFSGDKKFFDSKTGNLIDEEDIDIGNELEVYYSGEVEGKNPTVIKAYKVYVLDYKAK